MRYIINGDKVSEIVEAVLDYIRDSFPSYEDHFWMNNDGNSEISKEMYDEIERYIKSDEPYLKGFEDNEDYIDYVIRNKETISLYLEQESDDIYNDYNIQQYNIKSQAFYKALYYDNSDACSYKALHTIGKLIVKDVLQQVKYWIDWPNC